MTHVKQAIANAAEYPLCPASFAKIEHALQDVTGDRRYTLDVRAFTGRSAIFIFRGHRFYIYKMVGYWDVELIQD